MASLDTVDAEWKTLPAGRQKSCRLLCHDHVKMSGRLKSRPGSGRLLSYISALGAAQVT
jgi:hypothetical protein